MTLKEHKIESSKLKELNFKERNGFYEHNVCLSWLQLGNSLS